MFLLSLIAFLKTFLPFAKFALESYLTCLAQFSSKTPEVIRLMKILA